MRHFVNAYNGYADDNAQRWEQVRVISYWSCFPHVKNGKNLKPSDLFPLPGDKTDKNRAKQTDKKDHYKLLEKWSK